MGTECSSFRDGKHGHIKQREMFGMRADQETSQLLLPVHHLPVLLRPLQVPEEQEGEPCQRCAVDGEVQQCLREVRRSLGPWKRERGMLTLSQKGRISDATRGMPGKLPAQPAPAPCFVPERASCLLRTVCRPCVQVFLLISGHLVSLKASPHL